MQKTKAISMVEELRECDHMILSVQRVYEFSTVFGFKIQTVRYPDYLMNCPAKCVYGLSSDALAETICHRFGVKYAEKIGLLTVK